MANYLTSQLSNWWPMHHQEFWNAMGMHGPAGHWPDEGIMHPYPIQGFRCRVLPQRGGLHRAQIQCNQCTKWIFQGRLHQHVDTDACLNQQG